MREALRLLGLHAAELGPPAVIRLLADGEVLDDLRHGLAAGEHGVSLAQLVDDLLR